MGDKDDHPDAWIAKAGDARRVVKYGPPKDAPEDLEDDISYSDPEARLLGKTVRVHTERGYVHGIITGYQDCDPRLESRRDTPRRPKRELGERLKELACGPGYPKIRVLITDPRQLEEHPGLKEEDWYPYINWQVKWEEGLWI